MPEIRQGVFMSFNPFDSADGRSSSANSSGRSPVPRRPRGRRDIDPHEELSKLQVLGVDSFQAVCLVRGRRVDKAFVGVHTSRPAEQDSLPQLEEAADVAGDMARVVVEKMGMPLADDAPDEDVFIELLAMIDTKDGLPRFRADLRALTGSDRAVAARHFGLL